MKTKPLTQSMQIASYQKMTLLDYPGQIAAIVFTQGCVLACGYCHNPELVACHYDKAVFKDRELEFFEFLQTRQGLLDGVVITGGEPTLQKDLPQFLSKIKELGFKTKLDTNGVHPDIVGGLSKNGLVDYWAMDIKHTPEKYMGLVKLNCAEQIQESIRIIQNSGIPYEFRSTILPQIHNEEDLCKMGKMILGSKKWVLQSFRPQKTLHPSFRNFSPFSDEQLRNLQKIAENFVSLVEIRS